MIEAQKHRYPVRVLCRVLGVSVSGYYGSVGRVQSARSRTNGDIVKLMKSIHQDRYMKHYGSPRMTAELKEREYEVGENRVARLMRIHGLIAAKKKRFRHTTDSAHAMPIADNVLNRNFEIKSPNRVWASDITYLWTRSGWCYLAVVKDIGTRKIVGWALDMHMRTELCIRALTMAIQRERPSRGLIHHSDRGSQYASQAYRSALKAAGIVPSMSRKGNCWDNAVAESQFATLKTEMARDCLWNNLDDALRDVFEYIEIFYNRKRKHSALGYISPVEYEKSCP